MTVYDLALIIAAHALRLAVLAWCIVRLRQLAWGAEDNVKKHRLT